MDIGRGNKEKPWSSSDSVEFIFNKEYHPTILSSELLYSFQYMTPTIDAIENNEPIASDGGEKFGAQIC